MRKLIVLLSLIVWINANAQQNIVIVTLDGVRWQEVFGGADSTILFSGKFLEKDSASTVKKYSFSSALERRKAIFPFLWSTIAKEGQIYGNRWADNKMNVKNRYWFSYPGYNEIFTGFPDTLVNSNDYMANPNENVLGFLNKQKEFNGKVIAFTNWNAFKRILNEGKSGFMVNDGIENLPVEDVKASAAMAVLDKVQFSVPALWDHDRMDGITYEITKEYMRLHHPKVTYLSFGETDEWAHSGKYDFYLDGAHAIDGLLNDLWVFLQSDKQYKGKTTLLITTDHGRGFGKDWTSHNNKIPGCDAIWFAAIGPNVSALGEVKTKTQLYQAQLAQTIAAVLGYTFTTNHPVEEKIASVLK